MDITVILTGVGTVLAVVGSNVALISWLRSDMKSFESEVRGWKEEIQKESKDFHGRLCSLESRYHNEDMKNKIKLIHPE